MQPFLVNKRFFPLFIENCAAETDAERARFKRRIEQQKHLTGYQERDRRTTRHPQI